MLTFPFVFLLISLSGFHLELFHWFYQANYEILQFINEWHLFSLYPIFQTMSVDMFIFL